MPLSLKEIKDKAFTFSKEWENVENDCVAEQNFLDVRKEFPVRNE